MATRGKAQQRTPAEHLPIARVLVDVALPAHLDRTFDYRVPEHLSASARVGCRVRVRFRGKLADGFVLERAGSTDFPGKLAWLERVASAEPVLTPELLELCRGVAARYGGMVSDVVRLAVPPRSPSGERTAPTGPAAAPARPAAEAWQRYARGPAFLDALAGERGPRAVWQALPGEDWPRRLAEAAATAASSGRGALLVVPDHRDLARLHEACVELLGTGGVVALTGELPPAERYRRWLAVLRGCARVVVGTRGAMFAPVRDLGLAAVWDDGDELHSYPQVPYPHVRDVLTHRAHSSGAGLLVGAFARTAEAQLLVESGWAPEITADRGTVRAASPRMTAIGEHDSQLARDPAARAARLPSVAFDAARAALQREAPVLVQVPRRGYVPALACADCRERARCRHCAGPLALSHGDGGARPASCRWCGATEAAFRCPQCGSRRLRAVAVGAERTAEELGRAFSNVPVRTSGAGDVLATVPARPALIVSTPGAEPAAEGGYGAALLLDGSTLLGRPELRATETALRLWFTAAALVRPASAGGRVVVMADSDLQPVQALVRWDPGWYAELELAEREQLGFPPARRVAAVDGTPEAVESLVDSAELPDTAEVLGPVPLSEIAGASAADEEDERERLLVRVDRSESRALAQSLHAAQVARAARKASELRVRLDPLEMI
ncbi:primosomal protein N' [Salinifilum aidingensis]